MFAAIFTLGLLEIIATVVFFGWFCAAISWDRSYRKSDQKWYALFWLALVGVVYLTFVKNGFWNFSWLSLTNVTSFLVVILYYLGFGVIYSPIELYFEARRSRKYYGEVWEKFIDDSQYWCVYDESGRRISGMGRSVKATPRKVLKDAQLRGPCEMFSEVLGEVRIFWDHKNRGPIEIQVNPETIEILPEINGKILAAWVGAWVCFWPFYAVTLVFEDLFRALKEILASVLKRLYQGVILAMFRDTFKV